MKRQQFWAVFMLLFTVTAMPAIAQPGIDELHQVSGTVSRWYFNLSDLVLAIGAISGMVGGLRVFAAWQAGRHHIETQVTGWLLACIFLSLAGGVLKLLFGI